MTDSAFASDFSMTGMPPVEAEKITPSPKKISGDADFDALSPGAKFIDPDGKQRVKPYSVKNDSDYLSVPEGEQFIDPEGQTRQKPKFEGIDFTAQTLYDMSVTPSERKKSLERSYPGKVKEDAEGLFIDDGGKLRRPGRGMSAVGGFAASAAAPTVGAVTGALGLGAVSGPVGGAVGGAGGAMLGQTINDAVLQLAGVYDRSITEQAAATGMAGAGGMLGSGVGRGVATMVPAAKAGVSSLSGALPSVAAHFLGAGSAETTMARELAEKGVQVPPSAWTHEAPHLQNIVEVFDPAFRTNKPLRESAVKYYEEQAGKVLDDLGVKRTDSITEPKSAVPTQATGEKILQRTLAESAQADQTLKSALDKRVADLQAGLPENIAQREALTKAAESSRQQAQKLIDQSFASIQEEAGQAMKLAEANTNTGELWENIGQKLQAVRQGIAERANKMYGEADQLAGAHKPNTEGLSEIAADFRNQLPGDFKNKYPDVVKKLEELAGTQNEAGEWIKEPVQPTFGQLHQLRSLLRGNADWYTLSSDLRNGTYKFFSKRVDDALRDVKSVPELKPAIEQLDRADKFYRANIPIFESQQIKAVMKGLEAGEPADPANLYRVVVKEGHSDLTRRVRDMVGPNLWSGVRAADTRTMLDASKSLEPGVIDARKFAKEVLDRHRANMLEVVHGKDAEKLLAQARAIEQLDGRLPIPVKADDTMTQVIARARMASDEAKAAGAKDPLGTLQKEMKKIQAEGSREQAKLRAERRSDPLGFLHDPTTGAVEAVDKILGSEDLILAASAKFGDKSPEFNMLRQVHAQRVLQGTLQPGAKLEKISPEVQQLMFPGVTLNQMQTLAKEMEFLTARRGLGKTTAGSMSAMSKIENPVTGIPGVKAIAKSIPGLNPMARAARGKFYAMITDLATSPTTLRWIEKGLTSGNPEQREAVRQILQKHLQRGTAMGAGAGEAVEQGGMPQ